MKIVLFPGVGFHEDVPKYEKFLKKIQKEIDCEVEVIKWTHSYLPNSHESGHTDLPDNLGFMAVRGLFSEVILDFQHVLNHAHEMEIPEADVYMGHSAGSIIALAMSKGKHCVSFGSPISLIETMAFDEDHILRQCGCGKTPLLNFVHEKDVIAYPIFKGNTENIYINSSLFSFSRYNPITAHGSYWKSKKVLNKTIATLKEWGY